MKRQELIGIMIEMLKEEGFKTVNNLPIENVKQFLDSPLTLAEFFGWEEGVEYRVPEFLRTYRIVNNKLEHKVIDNIWRDSWNSNETVRLNPASINNFRNAERLKVKKYYILNPELKYNNYLHVVNLHEDGEEIYFGRKRKLCYGVKTRFSEYEYECLKEKYATVSICKLEEVVINDTKI